MGICLKFIAVIILIASIVVFVLSFDFLLTFGGVVLFSVLFGMGSMVGELKNISAILSKQYDRPIPQVQETVTENQNTADSETKEEQAD